MTKIGDSRRGIERTSAPGAPPQSRPVSFPATCLSGKAGHSRKRREPGGEQRTYQEEHPAGAQTASAAAVRTRIEAISQSQSELPGATAATPRHSRTPRHWSVPSRILRQFLQRKVQAASVSPQLRILSAPGCAPSRSPEERAEKEEQDDGFPPDPGLLRKRQGSS